MVVNTEIGKEPDSWNISVVRKGMTELKVYRTNIEGEGNDIC